MKAAPRGRRFAVLALPLAILAAAARPAAAPRVVIVGYDDQVLNQARWPVNRAMHARLLDRLSAAGATVVVFEPVFAAAEDADHAGDTVFAEAVRRHGRVVLGAAMLPPSGIAAPDVVPSRLSPRYARAEGHRVRNTDRILLPDPAFVEAAYAVGFVNLFEDPDHIHRHATAILTCGGRALPSLGAAAAMAVLGLDPAGVEASPDRGGRLSDGILASDLRGDVDLDPEACRPAYVPYLDVVEGRCPPDLLRGAVVFVQLHATGAFDSVHWDGHPWMPRARVHAAEMTAYLTRR